MGAADSSKDAIGVYLHIPYCERICHYCDFAKTARYSDTQVAGYFKALVQQWQAIAPLLPAGTIIDTVFVGGGTPSLFIGEYEPLLAELRPWLSAKAELTIEVNPLHATADNLRRWHELGFNRISLGVQSFHDDELTALTRLHRRAEAIAAVERAKATFHNVSVDLIYGLEGQSAAAWQQSIRTACALGADHLSMYTLTYEGNTVFNRRKNRKLMTERSDETLAQFYDDAMRLAAGEGYQHYEVSNWAKAGKKSQHNQKYWQMLDYLALGTGAHGFLGDTLAAGRPAGERYSFSPKTAKTLTAPHASAGELKAELQALGANFESGRTTDDYLSEAVLSSVRTAKGVDVAALAQRLGLEFKLPAGLKKGIEAGSATYENGVLSFAPKEWYLEYSWVHQVLDGFESES